MPRILLATPIVLLFGFASMILNGDTARGDEPAAKRIVVIAHRGEHREYPENTLPAIAAAVEMGCDYVELDVRETRDGALVLIRPV